MELRVVGPRSVGPWLAKDGHGLGQDAQLVDECDNDRELERGAQDQIIAVCAPLVAKPLTNRETCKQHDGNQRRAEEPECREPARYDVHEPPNV